MKVVILAGGLGTRLSEETETIPKPMVHIGDRPMLWHIMKGYGHYGFNEFVLALGYKGEAIKHYFMDYCNLSGNITVDLAKGSVQQQDSDCEDWTLHLMDTGQDTLTGGRVKRLEPLLRSETFMLTYGDGVGDIDAAELLRFHRSHGKLATVTAVRPPARFGGLLFNGDQVIEFSEKPQIGEGWINGGFLVLEPEVIDYLHADNTSLEADGLEQLASDGQLMAYRHDGFWQCMDTLRDVRLLRSLWQSEHPPWKVWD